MDRKKGRSRIPSLIMELGAMVVAGGGLPVPPACAQTNYIAFNNGSDWMLIVPGANSSGTNPNLYYRCYPRESLYAPQDGSPDGLDVVGLQFAITNLPPPMMLGTPLFFFVGDPGGTCILSAAIGGGFPPNHNKIVSSPNTLDAFSWYTPSPSAYPFAWWFSFQGSTSWFQAPDPAMGGGNLLAGWSDPLQTTTQFFGYPVLSWNETSSEKSHSFMNLNAAGMGNQRLLSNQEWGLELQMREPTVQPEMTRGDGTWDPGGAGGYSPAVDPGRQLRFRSSDLAHAGTGVFSISVANLTYQASADACHLPGVTILGQQLPVNVDFFWILTASSLVGPAYSPPSASGSFWDPNAGWTPGGESLSPPMPIGLPALIGLQMCFGSFGFDPAGPPFLVAASQGSTLRFR